MDDRWFEYRNVDKVENYFKDFLKGSSAWRILRILVFGHGRIGKTTLVTALEHIQEVPRTNFVSCYYRSEGGGYDGATGCVVGLCYSCCCLLVLFDKTTTNNRKLIETRNLDKRYI